MAPLSTILTTAAAATLGARDFSYHSNNVRFLGPFSGYFSTGTYAVTSLSISAGQDPSSYNKVGEIYNSSMIDDGESPGGPKKPGFTFEVGRHKTSDVANWWNSQIPASKNTFGHTAGQLNIAFIGDLNYTIVWSDGSSAAVHVPDVGLAQGQEQASDGGWTVYNWWMGGPSCNYISGNKVTCPASVVATSIGVNSNPNTTITFQRGGKGEIFDIFITDPLA